MSSDRMDPVALALGANTAAADAATPLANVTILASASAVSRILDTRFVRHVSLYLKTTGTGTFKAELFGAMQVDGTLVLLHEFTNTQATGNAAWEAEIGTDFGPFPFMQLKITEDGASNSVVVDEAWLGLMG